MGEKEKIVELCKNAAAKLDEDYYDLDNNSANTNSNCVALSIKNKYVIIAHICEKDKFDDVINDVKNEFEKIGLNFAVEYEDNNLLNKVKISF